VTSTPVAATEVACQNLCKDLIAFDIATGALSASGTYCYGYTWVGGTSTCSLLATALVTAEAGGEGSTSGTNCGIRDKSNFGQDYYTSNELSKSVASLYQIYSAALTTQSTANGLAIEAARVYE